MTMRHFATACLSLLLAAPALCQASVTGAWQGTLVDRRGEHPFALVLLQDAAGAVVGGIESDRAESPLAGRFDAETDTLTLQSNFSDPAIGRIDLELIDGVLVGTISSIEVSAERTASEPPELPAYWVPLEPPVELPRTVDLDGLPAAIADLVDERILDHMDQQNLVGLSAAFVLDGVVVDVRSYGWQDLAQRIPATRVSTYRWASISKPMTAVAALQLFERGDLDLDADVRDYVPEFPEKPHTITSRQLLCHQGGIVHYSNGVVIRTQREYDVPHPFGDRVLALDMFKESPLVCTPGSQYSYSTPGYALLGAVVERAGGVKFSQQVRERIAEPLGMSSLQPDHEWLDIAHRSPGYRRTPGGQLFESSGSDKVSWKLAAGGWTSTAEDLARFGAGVARGELLDPETWELALAPQAVADGSTTTAALGFRVFELGGHRMAAHSGAQQKTSTYLVIDLDARAAVALMCNTRGTLLGRLGQSFVQWLAEAK